MIKQLKEIKGITLIALVITIIVLLILAGVAITMLSGENGILKKAGEAKTNIQKVSIEERIKLAILAAKTDAIGGNIKGDVLKEELENQGIKIEEQIPDTEPYIFKDETGKEYVVMNDGKIGTTQAKEGDWIYTIIGQNARITGCRLTGDKLKNVIIPKYLEQEDGTMLTVTQLGDDNNNIANFSGTLVIPNNVTIYKYAFNNCPDLKKVIFGDNISMERNSGGTYQFTAVNSKLKEVQIGNNCIIEYCTFTGCPIENIIIGNGVTLEKNAFIKCMKIKKIDIKDNVTIKGAVAFGDMTGNSTLNIDQINIGNNFTSTDGWLSKSTIGKVTIGDNASFGDNGLSSQYNAPIIGEITLNGRILKLGSFALSKCKINAPEGILEIVAKDGEETRVGEGAFVKMESNLEKIIFNGSNGSIKFYLGNWQVISRFKGIIELNGNINSKSGYGPFIECSDVTIGENANIGEYVFSKSTVTTLTINKNATIQSTCAGFKNIVIKDVSQWDAEKLTVIKEWIGTYITSTPIENMTQDTLTYTK